MCNKMIDNNDDDRRKEEWTKGQDLTQEVFFLLNCNPKFIEHVRKYRLEFLFPSFQLVLFFDWLFYILNHNPIKEIKLKRALKKADEETIKYIILYQEIV